MSFLAFRHAPGARSSLSPSHAIRLLPPFDGVNINSSACKPRRCWILFVSSVTSQVRVVPISIKIRKSVKNNPKTDPFLPRFGWLFG